MSEGLAAWEFEDVRRQRDRLADDALGLVAAAHAGERDPGAPGRPTSPAKNSPMAWSVPFPSSMSPATTNEGRPALDRVVDQGREGLAARRGGALRQRGVATREARERAAQDAGPPLG